MADESKSLQERYAPNNACWGCGPANPEGLRIRSFPRENEVMAEWKPEKRYEAFPGVLNGGIIGTLLDCHCNWTAAWHLMNKAGEDQRALHGDRGLCDQVVTPDSNRWSGLLFRLTLSNRLTRGQQSTAR